jgi:hypothetical protein
VRLVLALLLVATATRAHADPLGNCYDELAARHITYKKTKKPGIARPVEVMSQLGGVEVTGNGPLVIDCSLVVSLDEAGRYMKALGMTKVHFASAYSRRNVRGTNHPSKHSYGLAIDVSAFAGPAIGTLRVDNDYEQGLGDAIDCVGQPVTRGGAILKVLQCQLVRSGLFHLVLSPDYDDAHHDHYHLEAIPWQERSALRASSPAIH